MKRETLFEVLGEIDEAYVKGAKEMKTAEKKRNWKAWGAMAACLCLVVGGGVLLRGHGADPAPAPAAVEVVSPFLEVASVEEMEEYLDFDIPVLEKEIAVCQVYVEDGYPRMGQVDYADGTEFRMKYGSGDISGIFGAAPTESRDIDGITVSWYRYDDADGAALSYAAWERDGFTFSYAAFQDEGSAEVEQLVKAAR